MKHKRKATVTITTKITLDVIEDDNDDDGVFNQVNSIVDELELMWKSHKSVKKIEEIEWDKLDVR